MGRTARGDVGVLVNWCRRANSTVWPELKNAAARLPTLEALCTSRLLMEGLRSEPARIAAQRADVAEALKQLAFSQYDVPLRALSLQSETRAALAAAAGDIAPDIAAGAGAVLADVHDVEGELSRLQAAHGKLRRTVTQYNTLLDLLEAPSLMENFVRTGMYDEALEVSEYASYLYFTHRLWAGQSAGVKPAGGAALVRQIVGSVRGLADEMRERILTQLAGKVSLPVALRLLGQLRRYYTQQALAAKRVAAHLAASAGAAGGEEASGAVAARPSAAGALAASTGSGSISDSSSSIVVATASGVVYASDGRAGAEATPQLLAAFALTPAEDALIVSRLRSEFLRCRDAWHRWALDSISRHNAATYLLRVIDEQRTAWAEVAAQYSAVCSALRPAGATGSGSEGSAVATTTTDAVAEAAVADAAAARDALRAWLDVRLASFLRLLSSTLPDVDDGEALASLTTAATYASRRAGRLGLDYSHLVLPLLYARVRALATERLFAAGGAFREAVTAWTWAFKAPLPAPAPAPAPGDAPTLLAVLSPPPELQAFPPLADAANRLAGLFNSLRGGLPADGGVWWREEVQRTLAAMARALGEAEESEAYPPRRAAAARSRGAAGKGGQSSTVALAPSARALADDAAALARFEELCAAFTRVFFPYAAAFAAAVVGLASGASTGAPLAHWSSIAAAVEAAEGAGGGGASALAAAFRDSGLGALWGEAKARAGEAARRARLAASALV